MEPLFFGNPLVDAKAAVRLAETWTNTPQTSANDAVVFQDFLDSTRTVSTRGTTFSRSISRNIDIEHVEVDISFTRWYDLGDLEVHLISPNGTRSILIDNSGEDNGSFSGGFGSGRWEFFSNAFRGEDTVGTWRVELYDADSTIVSPITVNDIDITFSGQTDSINDTLIFTEEFSDYAGRFGHSRHIDGGVGIDTINAAAVDSSTTIDLSRGTGSIDGVNITVSSIEKVVTGDGNDQLVGNSANNRLAGSRGNDRLSGNGGRDTLLGGAGNDWINGGSGLDYHDGGDGIDTIDYTHFGGGGTYDLAAGTATSIYVEQIRNFENINTGGGNDRVIGTSWANFISAGNGNDTVLSGCGNDTVYGGAGNDRLFGETGHDLLVGDAGNDYLNGTSYTAQGTGERDTLISHSYQDQDIFVLGERQGYSGRVFYNDAGNSDYALIRGFDVYDFAGDIADKIQLLGSAASYRLANVSVNGIFGAGISFGGDLIGLIEGVNSSSLNLSNSNNFTYV